MKKRNESSPDDKLPNKKLSPDDHAGDPPKSPSLPAAGISRRNFLTYAAGAGILAGLPENPLAGENRHRKKYHGHKRNRDMELRTYVFNLSHMDTSFHNLTLVAGTQRVQLESVTPRHLQRLRRLHPILRVVPDLHMTHIITLRMPADAVQLCYIQRTSRFDTGTSWDMALMFHHLPTSALHHAALRRRRIIADGEGQTGPRPGRYGTRRGRSWRERDPRWDTLAPVPVKWARYGITPKYRATLSDPVGEDLLKDTTDQATSLVAGYPELTSTEPDSAAHINTNIIGTQSQTQLLGEIIASQGPATTTGGWATQTPLIDPDTNQPFKNSSGDDQLMPVWSDETQQFAGQAIAPALQTTKNDTTLGANITNVDPETVSDVLTDDPTTGAVWTLHDGMPTVDQSGPDFVPQQGAFSFQFNNQSPEKGYRVEIVSVDDSRTITIQVKNWYVRYLGLYVRYLDGNNQPIAVSSIADTLQASGNFPLWDLGLNGEFDVFLSLINPEFLVYGIPVQSTTIKRTFPMPETAVSVQILSGGLGGGNNPFPDTLIPGKVMTLVVDIALPTLFLALAAGAGLTRYTQQLQITSLLISTLQILVNLFQGTFLAATYDSPTALIRQGVVIGQLILTAAAQPVRQSVAEAISEGEAVEAVEDSVPFLGTALAGITALGLVSQLTQSSAEVAQSPQTYAGLLTFTHDIEVTINKDPDDPAGFPATATTYTLTATFDSGTPFTISGTLSGTVTGPIIETFINVPFGGNVTVSVGFYSDSGWLAGQGSVGPQENTSADEALMLSITIKENLVPLQPDTGYSHKEIIALNDNGNHVWDATTAPPTAPTTPEGQCESGDGQLCEWTGITVSTISAAVGYAWQAYNSAVTNCSTGAVSQLHQFANLSITENPQSEYLFSGCGFSGTARIVYDLLGKKDLNFYLDPTDNNNFVRQIRLSGATADFDGPDSNKAWGRFRFPSDAMLLHPAGRVISINEALNKIEITTLPDAATTDADAPVSEVYSGTGIREGLLGGPTHAALDPDGTILILETKNNRIQAFDLGANPVPKFSEGAYFVNLVDVPTAYLDLAVEYTGYLYVLSYIGQPGSLLFRLDIYTPEGEFLARTEKFNAAKLAVNYWRDVFALNYQVLKLPDGSLPARTEPSVSHWIPSTPS